MGMNPVNTLGMRVFPGVLKPINGFGLKRKQPGPPSNPYVRLPGRLHSIPGLLILLRPNSLNVGTGNTVLKWADSSGYGNDVSATSTVLTQAYDSVLQSKCLRGSGSLSQNPLASAKNFSPILYTFYAMMRMGSFGYFAYNYNGSCRMGLNSDNTGHFGVFGSFSGGTNLVNAFSGYRVITFCFDQNASIINFYVNNVLQSFNGTTPSTCGTAQPWKIGGPDNPVSDSAFNGDLFEVGIWNRALNSAEVAKIYTHAKLKFHLH